MNRLLGATALLLLVATMVFANGDEQHVIGTVTKITDTSITVKTADARSVDVSVTPDTKFTKAGQPISEKDVKQGDRIVIHAKKNGETLVATTVSVGTVKTDHVQDMKSMDMSKDQNTAAPPK
jgi:uncharacterized cupredoxin-like copper-binding protein